MFKLIKFKCKIISMLLIDDFTILLTILNKNNLQLIILLFFMLNFSFCYQRKQYKKVKYVKIFSIMKIKSTFMKILENNAT